MRPVINLRALIGWNILSSQNAVISTKMRGFEFITGHMVYNPAYNQILQAKETVYIFQILKLFKIKNFLKVNKIRNIFSISYSREQTIISDTFMH